MSLLKNALVTGGAVFMGNHLVDRLMQKGYRVTVLDNLLKMKPEESKTMSACANDESNIRISHSQKLT